MAMYNSLVVAPRTCEFQRDNRVCMALPALFPRARSPEYQSSRGIISKPPVPPSQTPFSCAHRLFILCPMRWEVMHRRLTSFRNPSLVQCTGSVYAFVKLGLRRFQLKHIQLYLFVTLTCYRTSRASWVRLRWKPTRLCEYCWSSSCKEQQVKPMPARSPPMVLSPR